LHQRGLEPGSSLAQAIGSTLAGTLVVARGGDQQPRAAYEERRADASHSLFAIRYGDDRHNAFAQDGPDRSTYRRGLGYDNIVTDSKKVLPRSFWAQNGASHFVL
jgi:hypothetical protein